MVVRAPDGGSSTARVSTAPGDCDTRERQEAAARRGVSAFAFERYPDDLVAARAWRDEVYAALGLSPAPDDAVRPGRCRVCDKELEIWRQSPTGGSAKSGLRLAGTCSAGCARVLDERKAAMP